MRTIEKHSKALMIAVERNSLEEVMKSLKNVNDLPDVINCEHGVYNISALQVAAFHDSLEIVQVLIKYGGRANTADRLGRTALHYAANNGSSALIRILVTNGAPVDAMLHFTTWKQETGATTRDPIPIPRVWGRTPLHLATAGLHTDCVRALLDGGASVETTDEKGLTPLLTTGEECKRDAQNLRLRFDEVIKLLLDHKANVDATDPATGTGALHLCLIYNSLETCKVLIAKGVDATQCDSSGNTVLHAACKRDNVEFVREFLKYCRSFVNSQNKKGETPLHSAAYSGSRSCLSLLLDHGGDLSAATSSGVTVADVIVAFVPRPVHFISETFDSRIIPNECSVNERCFNIILDFRLLSPNCEHQMSVLTALLNSMTTPFRSKIILHPLVETFIRLKWKRLRIFFFILVIIQFLFVMSLSVYACLLFSNGDDEILEWSRLTMLATATALLLHLAGQTFLAPKYYLREIETWLMVTCVCLSLSMGAVRRKALSDQVPLPEWIRHLAAYDVLLSWTQLMFILGRFPSIGYFALMFYTVLKNITKVLLFFACLVIGFSLSFCLQFNDTDFAHPWNAFVRTTVMLMGEFEYMTLFGENTLTPRFSGLPGTLRVTSRFIFLLFVFLGSIVLMNLMTGLAVNDIQGLKAEGNVRHMIKQVEFMTHVEKLLSRRFPRPLRSICSRRSTLPETVTLYPNTVRTGKIKYKSKTKNIPMKLLEGIIQTAIENQKCVFKYKPKVSSAPNDENNANVSHALTEIKDKLDILSSMLRDWRRVPVQYSQDGPGRLTVFE